MREELIRKWDKIKPTQTPVIFVDFNGQKIAIKDESQNITDTYKAKHGWMMGKHYLENVFPKKFLYYLGSTGNAGLADFAYADKLNEMIGEEKVLVANFYPEHYETKILGPDSFGRFTDGKRFREEMEKYKSGKVIQVNFKEKYWFGQPCLEKMKEMGLDTTKTMDITEGFQPTYEQVFKEFTEQIRKQYGTIPRTLAIVQFGAGMLYNDSKAVAKNLMDFMAVSTGNKNTIADKICDSSESWQESLDDLIRKGFTKAKNSGDNIYHVDEEEIKSALNYFRSLGIEAEPSGAAGMAMAPKIKGYDLIAVVNTGNGIKKTSHH